MVGDGRGGKKVTVLEAPGRGAALAREEGVGGGVRGERGRRAAGNGAAGAGASEGGGGHRRLGRWVRSVSRQGGMGWWRVARGGMVISGKWRGVGVGLSASSRSGAEASSRRKDENPILYPGKEFPGNNQINKKFKLYQLFAF